MKTFNANKLPAAACAALASFAVNAGTVTWNGTGGAFSSDAIWTGGTAPVQGDMVSLAAAADSGTNTVFLSADSATAFSRFTVRAAANGYVAFDGAGYDFLMPDLAEGGPYDKEQVHFEDVGGNHVLSVSGYDIANCSNAAPFKATNPYFVHGADADGNVSLVFSRGAYNFFDPDGTPYPARIVTAAYSKDAPSVRIAFEGADTSVVIPKLLFAAKSPTNILRFADGTYDIRGKFYSNDSVTSLQKGGFLGVDVDGANLTIGGQTRLYPHSDNGAASAAQNYTFRFNVRNGSTLTTTNAFYTYRGTNGLMRIENSTWIARGNGARDSISAGIGFRGDDYSYTTTQRLEAVNSRLEFGVEHPVGHFYVGSELNATKKTYGEAYMSNCTIVANAMFAINHGKAWLKDCTLAGNRSKEYSLVVTSDSELTVEDSVCTNIGGPRLNANSYSTRGPILRIKSGTVSNGYNEQAGIGAMSDLAAGCGVTSVVHQTGGLFESRFTVLSVKAQPGHFILEGGTYKSKTTCGGSGRHSDNPTKGGWAHFTANGGTVLASFVETYQFRRPLFYNLDLLEAGPGGLNVDTAGINHFMLQDLRNMPGERGRFTKLGAGTFTIHVPSKWDVSETVVETGTLLVSTNGTDAVGTPVVLESAVSVRSDATFSTVGAASAVTVDSLAVTNGTLALDPGDVITVKGDVSLRGLNVSFSSVPAQDAGQSFLVAENGLSDDAVMQLRTATLANGSAAGTYADFAVSTDGQGRTVVTMTVKASPAVSGETSWRGPGSTWVDGANWSADVPGAQTLAKFDDATAPAAVSLAGIVDVGALSFSAGAFSVGGSGALAFGAPGSSSIDVSAGSHAIGAKTMAFAQTPVNVDDGASLSITGEMFGQGLKKTGGGALSLAAPIAGTIESSCGLTTAAGGDVFHDATAVALGDGTLRVAAGCGVAPGSGIEFSLASTNTKTAVVIDNAADVTIEKFTATSGALIKRGAGRLVFDATGGGITELAAGTGDHYSDGMLQYSHGALFAFPENGNPPVMGFGGFNVAGGEVVIKSDSEVPPEVNCKGAIHVGLRTSTDCGSQPSLTIDHVYLKSTASYQHFTIGLRSGDSGDFTTNPVVRIVNGATLESVGVFMGYGYDNNTKWNSRPVFAVTNSTVKTSGQTGFSMLRYAGGFAQLTASNATMYAETSFEFSGNTKSRVTDSVLAGKNGAYGKFYADCYGAGEVLFDGGTTLKINTVSFSAYDSRFARTLVLAFNGATWDFGDADFTLDSANVYLDKRKFEMRGDGLTLPVPEGRTFRSDATFFGSGRIVKTGAGTLSFGNGAYAVTGVADVREGVLDLSAAGTLTNRFAVAGAGTVRGGSFGQGARIVLDADDDWSGSDVPTFDGCTFSGKTLIDFGRTPENPMDASIPQTVLVGRYENGKPNLSRFKLDRTTTGLATKLGGTFTAENGEIWMTVDLAGGTIVIVE